MKILLTGGAGTLGTNLLERYLPLNYDICIIDNFATGHRDALPDHPNLEIFEGSVADAELVNSVYGSFKPTHVINSAASYKDPDDWVEDSKTNILGTINICKAAQTHGISKIVNFQTALCYGRPKEIPIPITHETQPFTSYGISKTAGEQFLLNSGLPVVSLRLANLCGPRLSIGPIPTFYKRLKDGKDCFCSDTVRDFLDISDFFEIVDKALSDVSPLGVFNVSTGEGNSIHDVFREVAKYLKLDIPEVKIVPVGEDDVKSVVLDPAETVKLFNWKAKVTFEDTIKNQLMWYDKYGVDHIYSHLKSPK